MVKYRLIIEYHQKGNNNTQVATLCSCSRMTVWKVINRLTEADISAEELLELSDEKINSILFPERKKQSDGYLIPDYKWEDYQMRKRGVSIRLCWRRYCKRATYQNLKAYSWASYIAPSGLLWAKRQQTALQAGSSIAFRFLQRSSREPLGQHIRVEHLGAA